MRSAARLLAVRRRAEVRPKDAWDKAAVLSSFLSSVVIALVGIAVSYWAHKTQLETNIAIQQAQERVTRYTSDRDARLQQGRFTTDLLTHLLSSDPAHRRIAVIVLRKVVDDQRMADSILAVLARGDIDPDVRTAAFDQLQHTLVDGAQTLSEQQNALNFLEQRGFLKVVSYAKSSDSTKNNEARLEAVPFGQQPGPLTLQVGDVSTPKKPTEAFRGTVFVESAEKFVIGSR